MALLIPHGVTLHVGGGGPFWIKSEPYEGFLKSVPKIKIVVE